MMIRPDLRIIHYLILAWGICPALFSQEEDPGKTWNREWNNDDRWNQMDTGPFMASVLRTPGGVVAKGLSIKLLNDQQPYSVAYDTQTCSFKAAWTGGFLKFNPNKFGVVRAPEINGKIQVQCSQPTWGNAKVRYNALFSNGQFNGISYEVNNTKVEEIPWSDGKNLYRLIAVHPHPETLRMVLTDQPSYGDNQRGKVLLLESEGAKLETSSDAVRLEIPPSNSLQEIHIAYTQDSEFPLVKQIEEQLFKMFLFKDHRWEPTQVTAGKIGKEEGAFALDTIHVPFDNPWNALMFITGHDFFSNGDMAVCTLHGDVWLVSGLDETLKKVVWKRFATGLHQPLGLRIVDDRVYVLGRDQITLLEDDDGPGEIGHGEADAYINFNNEGMTSTSGHDYAACLETDSEGNFYYIRAHEGVCKVSKDGKTHTSIAEGFRNPIGLGVGPNGVITASPQEGNWTPASCIIQVKQGGYYGFPGPRNGHWDQPLCWMPRVQDTSSGGQVWVSNSKWGALKDRLLHLSYGQCRLMLVNREKVGNTWQGGTYTIPGIRFNSGSMTARFSPKDGHLYVTGLRGWQTAGTKYGCLQRVRYTSKHLRMPLEVKTTKTGIQITFTDKLDEELAEDVESFTINTWNYKYSSEYGSKMYKPSSPDEVGKDKVTVKSAKLLSDQKTVDLTLSPHLPVMQMSIEYDLDDAKGEEMYGTLYQTIHQIP
jgi:hypothetical protein